VNPSGIDSVGFPVRKIFLRVSFGQAAHQRLRRIAVYEERLSVPIYQVTIVGAPFQGPRDRVSVGELREAVDARGANDACKRHAMVELHCSDESGSGCLDHGADLSK
jgi:hypothetical protein